MNFNMATIHKCHVYVHMYVYSRGLSTTRWSHNGIHSSPHYSTRVDQYMCTYIPCTYIYIDTNMHTCTCIHPCPQACRGAHKYRVNQLHHSSA